MYEDIAIVNDGGENMNDIFTVYGADADRIRGIVMSGRRQRSSDGWDGALVNQKKPMLPIRLNFVVCAEVVRPSLASSFNVVTVTESDEKACQDEVIVDDCILGACYLM